MSPLLTTLEALIDHMAPAALALHADVPGGRDARLNIPAEVAVFTSPDLPGGCMVWGRTDQGWHANHGERAAISILLAKMKEQV
jgi:hypothetical protein